jgi:DNA-binding HxlR family transcriptional regulator
MRRVSFKDMDCSVAQTLEVVGEWWTMLIVRDAFLGVRRFDEFQARLGIARNVLTNRLDRLVEHDILVRVPYQDRPVRHEYRLTDKGQDLFHLLTAMRQWGDKWAAPAGRPLQLVHEGCGQVADAVPACSACGERLGPHNVHTVPGRPDAPPLPSRASAGAGQPAAPLAR